MNEEIKQLKSRVEATKNNDTPWFSQVLEKFGNEILSIFTSPFRMLDNIVCGVNSLLKKN